jgi:hypothetical protein
MCRVHKDAGVLWGNDRLDDVGNIVYIWESFYAEKDIVERLLGRMGGIFRSSDDCEGISGTAVASYANIHTSVRLESLVAVERRSGNLLATAQHGLSCATHLNEMPYWATLSYPDFHTRVTSQAFVACSRQDKKADTALPPTV